MTVTDPVRVAVVNDYEIVVVGVSQVLSRYRDRVEVVELDAQGRVVSDVDVVLYDSFGQEQGERVGVADLVRTTEAKVAVFSWNDQQDLVDGALSAGASAYLLKSLTGDQLVSAIEQVAGGRRLVPHRTPASGEPVEKVSETLGRWPGDEVGLSAREAEVLALICQGLTNDDITKRAYLSINTVKTYIRTLYRKIGVDSRTQAVLWGLDHGFAPDQMRRRLETS